MKCPPERLRHATPDERKTAEWVAAELVLQGKKLSKGDVVHGFLDLTGLDDPAIGESSEGDLIASTSLPEEMSGDEKKGGAGLEQPDWKLASGEAR